MTKMNQKFEPLFSLLIANYNNGRYLFDCFKSIFNQTYTNWEVVFVDDGSTDNSMNLIQSLSESDSRIKYFKNNTNHGCGFTKNRCIALSNGKICGFLDPEDTITKDAIEIMVRNHLENPESSLIFSSYYECNSHLIPIKTKRPILTEDKLASQLIIKNISHFATFKRQAYDKTQGINTKLKRAVDQDLYLKLEETGQVLYIDSPLYYYRLHEGGISTFSNRYKAEYWEYLVKHQACLRRGIDTEVYFAKVIEEKEKTYIKSTQFKIGSIILYPYHALKKLFKSKHNL